MIGGVGPESTVDYYERLIATYQARVTDGSYPAFFIDSVDVSKLIRWMAADQLAEVKEYLLAAVSRLQRAGADFGLIAANTPHVVFDELARQSPIPLLSIVEATSTAAQAAGLKRLALFGTRYTMQGEFYPRVFDRAGLALVRPSTADQDYLHDKYLNELIPGVFLPETRDRVLAMIDRLAQTEQIDAVILAGTELPLLLRCEAHNGIRLLDTGKIHVEAAVDWMLG